jgi:hypothetical protein
MKDQGRKEENEADQGRPVQGTWVERAAYGEAHRKDAADERERI